MKIGVMFGSPETTTGGNALKFYASMRLDIRRRESIKDGEEVIGNFTRVKVVKNKLAPPFRECTFEILYGQGIDRFGDLINVGLDVGVLEKSGSWIGYVGEKLGNGRPATIAKLRAMETSDPAKFAQLVTAVTTKETPR